MKTVDELMAEAFDRPRTPRSGEYKAGARAALQYRLTGEKLTFPYELGTAAADAYFAGTDEGHRIWRQASYTGTED